MNKASTPVQRPFTGFHMLAIMIAFFGVVIAVNIFLAVAAARSNSGLVVENSYAASQTFDLDTAKLRADAARDIHPHISYAKGIIDIVLSTSTAGAVTVKSANITLGRTVSATTDISPPLQRISDGHYQAAANLATGRWQGLISAELQDGNNWTRPVQLIVKAP